MEKDKKKKALQVACAVFVFVCVVFAMYKLIKLHMAHPNGRLCGAKRPKCEAERSSPL